MGFGVAVAWRRRWLALHNLQQFADSDVAGRHALEGVIYELEMIRPLLSCFDRVRESVEILDLGREARSKSVDQISFQHIVPGNG